MQARYRIVIIGLLLIATCGVNAQYAATDFRPYPNADDIIADQAQYDGREVLIFAEVETVDGERGEVVVEIRDTTVVGVSFDGFVPESDKVEKTHEITVRTPTQSAVSGLERGASIQAYGTITQDSTVLIAERVVADYKNREDWLYVLSTSLFGALLAIVHFFRYWSPDWRAFRFEKRGEP
jgi:hypothetical protein